MSQKSSLPQPARSVSRVLTADTCRRAGSGRAHDRRCRIRDTVRAMSARSYGSAISAMQQAKARASVSARGRPPSNSAMPARSSKKTCQSSSSPSWSANDPRRTRPAGPSPNLCIGGQRVVRDVSGRRARARKLAAAGFGILVERDRGSFALAYCPGGSSRRSFPLPMLPLPVASGHSVNSSGGSVIHDAPRHSISPTSQNTGSAVALSSLVISGQPSTSVPAARLQFEPLNEESPWPSTSASSFQRDGFRNWENVECETNSSLRTLIARRLVNGAWDAAEGWLQDKLVYRVRAKARWVQWQR